MKLYWLFCGIGLSILIHALFSYTDLVMLERGLLGVAFITLGISVGITGTIVKINSRKALAKVYIR
jgi:hypothetical protein